MTRAILLLPLLLLVASGSAAAEQASIRLRVSAMIQPRPCEYPNRCEQVINTGMSKASIADAAVRYVGSMPKVAVQDDLLTVIF